MLPKWLSSCVLFVKMTEEGGVGSLNASKGECPLLVTTGLLQVGKYESRNGMLSSLLNEVAYQEDQIREMK